MESSFKVPAEGFLREEEDDPQERSLFLLLFLSPKNGGHI